LTLSDGYSSSSLQRGRPGYDAQAAASVNLFSMSQVAGIKSSAETYSQDQAGQRQVSATLRFSLRSAFAQAYFAERTRAMPRQIAEIQARNADAVTLRYQSGKEYKGNMMNAKAQSLQAAVSVAQAQRGVRTARRLLDQQLGLDEFTETAV